MLELINLYAGYFDNHSILKGVNLRLDSYEKVAIFGQNGSGKSTIGKTIMGLVPHISGEILLDGNSIKGKSPQLLQKLGLGYFMQGGRVFGHLNAIENLKVATINLDKTLAKKQISRIQDEFSFFHNKSRVKLEATYLSGGERHQLALAMVIASVPNMKILIADEPSAGLSQFASNIIMNFLNEKKISMLLIEQNQKFAERISNKYVTLINGNIY